MIPSAAPSTSNYARDTISCGLSLFIAQRVGKSDQLLFESTQERFSRKQQIEVGRTDVRRTSRLQ